MKNSNYIINGILLVAVIVLFILHFTGRGANTKSPESLLSALDSTGFHLPIAYVQTDSLLKNYKLSIDLNDEMMKKIEDKSLSVTQRKNKLDRDAADFQQKVDNNVFLTQERIQTEYNRLMTQQQDLEKFAANVERELALEQQKMAEQMHNAIKSSIELFNTPKKYEMILTNVGTDNFLYADPSYDITFEVIEFLNSQYVPTPK